MLQAIAPPLMVAPAFAAAMGLDAALVLAVLLAGCAVTPFTAPVFAALFVGDALSLSPLTLGLKLFAIIVGAALIAGLVRWRVGAERIQRSKEVIDGINILVVYVFVAAVMENVAATFIATPLAAIGLAGLAFALCFGVLGLTAFVLQRAGADRAFVLGFAASQRNMGIMLAATAGALHDLSRAAAPQAAGAPAGRPRARLKRPHQARPCEERSDEAIHRRCKRHARRECFAALAMTVENDAI
jgi:BASS family bile acid:Na+ symporter